MEIDKQCPEVELSYENYSHDTEFDWEEIKMGIENSVH